MCCSAVPLPRGAVQHRLCNRNINAYLGRQRGCLPFPPTLPNLTSRARTPHTTGHARSIWHPLLQLPRQGRAIQRIAPAAARAVVSRPMLHQQRHHRRVAVVAGVVQRAVAKIVHRIWAQQLAATEQVGDLVC
jgi:hypothetical protein